MKLIVEYGDLFELDKEYFLAHAISSDFALGKGIALEFDKRYGMREKLKNNYTVNGDIPNCIRVNNVYNLVTKLKYWDKPTYKTLESCLILMRDDMLKNNIPKIAIPLIAIPLIGCGLDKLKWGPVVNILREVFKETSIEVRVRVMK